MTAMLTDLKEDRRKLLDEAIAALSSDKPKAEPAKVEVKKVEKPSNPKPKPKTKDAKKKPKAEKKKEATSPTGPPTESEMNEDVALDKCIEIFGEEDVKKVQETLWKVRLEGLQSVNKKLTTLYPDKNEIPTQGLVFYTPE